MAFVIPAQLVAYNGKIESVTMGPFEHSMEREFALTTSKKAIADCQSNAQLKEVATNLLQGWAGLQTALQSFMLENIQLRQALAKKELDLKAAEEIVNEASALVEQYVQQSKKAKRSLWPW
jgi:hypothetical protein